MKKRKHLSGISICMIAIVLCAFFLFTVNYLVKRQIRQSFIDKGIYEVDVTYSLVESKAIIYYMVCEPPSNDQELTKMIKQFLTEERVADSRKRMEEYVSDLGEDYPLDGFWFWFLEPSSEVDIGFLPEPGTIFKYYSGGHALAAVDLSLNSADDSEIRVNLMRQEDE